MFEAENIDYMLYIPVLEGYWKQHELWDGTYTIFDLGDILEAISIKSNNQVIIQENAREKAERESRMK